MAATDQMRAFLGTSVRIAVLDGRLFEGELQCMDSDMNFVLANATEYHGVEDVALSPIGEEHLSRYLGMTMVPGNHVVKVLALRLDVA